MTSPSGVGPPAGYPGWHSPSSGGCAVAWGFMACIRKLLTFLNAMVKHPTPSRPTLVA